MTLTQIGAEARELRRRAGLTQSQVADRAGLSKALVSKIERGRGNYTLEALLKVSRALSVELEIGFGGSVALASPENRLVAELASLIPGLSGGEKYTLWILFDGWRRRAANAALLAADPELSSYLRDTG